MLTTLLIVVPVAGALLVALLPPPRPAAAGPAPLPAPPGGRVCGPRLPRRADGGRDRDRRSRAVRLRRRGAPARDVARMGREPRHLVHRRLLRLFALSSPGDDDRVRRRDRLRALGRAGPRARVPRADAVPDR